MADKKKILCGWANPQDRQLNILPLSLARESQIMLDLHDSHPDSVDIKMITELTPERLINKIVENKPKILCISGHTVPQNTRVMFMPSEAFLKGSKWRTDTSFIPTKLSTNELTEFLDKCNTSICELDKNYKCSMSNKCYREYNANKILVKSEKETYSTTIHSDNYSRGFGFSGSGLGLYASKIMFANCSGFTARSLPFPSSKQNPRE